MNLKKKIGEFFTLARKNNGGFTLVELIVVIAILAILAGVAVPAYSGYIEKANMAADEQLLASLNTAFAAACTINGEDNYNRNDVSITLAGEEGSKTVASINVSGNAKVATSFASYFEGGEFKQIIELKYDAPNGKFVDANAEGGTSTYRDLFNTLQEKYGEEIAEVLTTSLGQIGTENLFDQMNGAMDMAGELNLHNLTGGPFAEAYFSYLGFNPSDYEDEEAAQAALDAKLAALGVDDATASTHAIALYAAQNSTNLTTGQLSQWLGSNKTTNDFMAEPNANTLAEAAAIYGMYLSYHKETAGTVPEGTTLDVMTKALSDGDFATWVNSNANAQTELDAYKTYMNIVNDAAKDETARNEILANGFKNPELESLMKDLMGN